MEIHYLGIHHSHDKSWNEAVNYVISKKPDALCVEFPEELQPYLDEILKNNKCSFATKDNLYYIKDNMLVPSLKKIRSKLPNLEIYFIDTRGSYQTRHEFMAQKLTSLIKEKDKIFAIIHENHLVVHEYVPVPKIKEGYIGELKLIISSK